MINKISFKKSLKKAFCVGIFFLLGVLSKDFIEKQISNLKEFHYENTHTRNLKVVNCPIDSISIAIFGQSNSSNSVPREKPIDIPKNLYQFDWRSKSCLRFSEPLLGTVGYKGNAITQTAINILREYDKPVLVIPFGIDGSSILDWSYGYLNKFYENILIQIKSEGIYPDFFLWHQGERDSKSGLAKMSDFNKTPLFKLPPKKKLGLSEKVYSESLQMIFNKSQDYFPNSKFGIALVSICFGRGEWQPIRNAQYKIAMRNKNAFISSDSDQIKGKNNRFDRCHFSSQGAEILGNQYFQSIKQLIITGK